MTFLTFLLGIIAGTAICLGIQHISSEEWSKVWQWLFGAIGAGIALLIGLFS